MRVFHTTNGKVQGGQLEAAIATAGEAAKLLSSTGGDIRFFLASAAGEEINGTVFSTNTRAPRPWPRPPTLWPKTWSSRRSCPG